MREEGIEAAYVFDSFVASHMEMMHRAMRAKLRSMAEEIGVPLKILELVMVIAAGEIDTAGEIADKFGVSRSLLSKNVEEAVRAGYIETAQDEKDRRVVRLRLTQRAGGGRALQGDTEGFLRIGLRRHRRRIAEGLPAGAAADVEKHNGHDGADRGRRLVRKGRSVNQT